MYSQLHNFNDTNISLCFKRFFILLTHSVYLHCRFKEENEIKYEKSSRELLKPELSTLEVSFDDVEKYNQNLATTIIEEYYRIYPFLNLAILNYVRSLADSGLKKDLQDKECYVSFVDVPTRHKVRELTTAKIGTLIRISGQIVRTHPVHPELVLGTFVCLDCQTIIKNVEQQFKVSVTIRVTYSRLMQPFVTVTSN